MDTKNISKLKIKSLVEIAVQKHQSGQWSEAELLYQQVLQIQSECVDELEYIQKEDQALVISNLGKIFERQGKLKAALEAYQQALNLKPDYAEAHHNLGNLFLQQRVNQVTEPNSYIVKFWKNNPITLKRYTDLVY